MPVNSTDFFVSAMTFFEICFRYIQWRRLRRNRMAPAILTLQNDLMQAMKYLILCYNIYSYLRRRHEDKYLYKPHLLLRLLYGYRATLRNMDVWNNLQTNWLHFYWLTGETPDTLRVLVDQIELNFNLVNHIGRHQVLSLRNQILLCFIWLRRYPTMDHLSMHFGISVSSIHRFIHKVLPVLHAYLVPKYIRWHTMNKWRSLVGTIPKFPSVVAIADCSPHRISKPLGPIQRLFYRGDRHCHFMNWYVIVDLNGFIVYSRPGFLGHLNDATCFRSLNIPVLPNGLHIMADQGFPHTHIFLVAPKRNARIQLPAHIRRCFRKHRSMIERVFGTMKFSYGTVGTRRFRNRRWIAPIVCNTSAAMYNKRKIIFQRLRQAVGV